jgi:hypothetical protein
MAESLRQDHVQFRTGKRCFRGGGGGSCPERGTGSAPRRARRSRAGVAAGLAALLVVASPAGAQSLQDGLLVPRRALGTGVVASQGSWDRHWEGTLKRDNENIGTHTTRSVTWMGPME